MIEDRSVIRVKYELRDSEGNLKVPSNQRQNVINYSITIDLKKKISQIHRINLNSEKPLIKGLKLAFLSMKVGEISWFKIKGEYNHIEQAD